MRAVVPRQTTGGRLRWGAGRVGSSSGVLDINKGNRQIAHGINRVLRPLDL